MSAARERLVAVLALLAVGGAAVLASTQPFAIVALAGVRAPLEVAGSAAAPALAPLGLAQVALAGALTIAGRIARTVLGAVQVVLGSGIVALVAPVVADPAAGTRGPVAAATGVTRPGSLVAGIDGTAWPLLAAVAGAAAVLLGVVVIVRARRWSTGGRRYRQPAGTAPAAATDPVSEWDALTRGTDPTSDAAADSAGSATGPADGPAGSPDPGRAP